jgi:hypothetical protein
VYQHRPVIVRAPRHVAYAAPPLYVRDRHGRVQWVTPPPSRELYQR